VHQYALYAMNRNKRRLLITIGSVFGAAFIHSILPEWDIWLRAATTGIAAAAIFVISAVLCRSRKKGDPLD
jgi:hypothetical protein